jgi:aerobic carbon-monoxide dehydrogenase large subunit
MGDMSSPIGQSIRRKEDARFLTGAGQYTDDVVLPGQTHGVFLRSPHAHARIVSINVDAAKAAPGVVAVFTGADLAEAKVGGLPCGWLIHNQDGTPMKEPAHPVLAQGKVRHVGDQVVLVVAETASQAKDACELIEVDYDVLDSVTETARAAGSAVSVHDDVPGNVCYDWGHGTKDAVEAAFKSAHKVSKLELVNNRLIPNAMEPRAANAMYTRHDESYTLYVANQNPHVERAGDRARRRRRLRLQDLPVRRGDRAGVGQQAGRPADQVDRRAQRIVPDRRARP